MSISSNQQYKTGQHASKPDSRVPGLTTMVRQMASQDPQPFRTSEDSSRSALGNLLRAEPRAVETAGLITHSIPALGWYRVQTTTNGVVSCTVARGNTTPMGPQTVHTDPVGTLVYVRLDPLLLYGVITGVVPVVCCDDRTSTADFLSAGAGVGYRREQLHTHPLQNFSDNGGAKDFMPGMPIDLLAGDRGFVTPTGLRLLINDLSVQLAVNEMCGVKFSYFDDSCRFAARHLLQETGAAEVRETSDEGELHAYRGVGLYPWELIGRYDAPGPGLTERQDDLDVLYKKHVSPIDLGADNRDAQPLYRWEEHAGYLANGASRSMSTPADKTGVRHRKEAETEPDDAIGVWREHVSPTGEYFNVSAKGLTFAKRVLIPIPRQRRLPADPAGDDFKKDNYKFSNQFGNGPPHKVADLPAAPTNPGLSALLAADDAIAFHLNWTALAGFHYHAKDWKVGDEKKNPKFQKVQEPLDYTRKPMPPATPVKLKIDSRYGQVDYYQSLSFLKFLDDGSVALADAYGTTIRMSGGVLHIDSPGDIRVSAGGTLAMSGEQVVIKARKSMDLSATAGDFRVKAEKNVQLLAANGGSGGMLFESKSQGFVHDFKNKTGEDVVDSGIVFKAKDSHVAAVAKEVYLRSVGGAIAIDADRGAQPIKAVASEVALFARNNVSFVHGPHDESSAVVATYYFDSAQMLCNAAINAGGSLTLFGAAANVVAAGNVLAAGSIQCAGKMADNSGGLLGKTKNLDSEIKSATGVLGDQVKYQSKTQQAAYAADVVGHYYKTGQIGNAVTISQMAFSYRDVDGGKQYGTSGFVWAGARWEALFRDGVGSGCETWVENPVSYQGRDLHPWPGRQAWSEDESYLKPAAPQFLDPQTLLASDRGSAYETPLPAPAEKGKMSELVQTVPIK